MSLKIRPVSLAEDRQEMVQLLTRNFGPIQEERFAWRHIDNPAGICWSWFAYDSNGYQKNAPVALVTVFPRHMRVAGTRVLGGQIGEFAVDPTHRSLGPAVQLQRATFEPVDSGEIVFCYDCTPHDRGMSTFIRLGMQPNCEVYRYALPLRCDEYVEMRMEKGIWSDLLIESGNLLLRMRRKHSAAPGLVIENFEGRFGDEFTHLDETVASSELIRASRAADDLNWRYRDDPMAPSTSADGASGHYQTLVARKHGELVAFAVFFLQTDGIASLVDIFGSDLSISGPPLLEAIVDICRKQHAWSLHGFCSDASELKALFLAAGLRRRERNSRVVAYPKQNGSKRFDAGLRWCFSQVEVML
jgi:Acetyltransferase (GNAT) domain